MLFSQWSTATKISYTDLGNTLYSLLFVSNWWLDIYPENEKTESILSDSRNIYISFQSKDHPQAHTQYLIHLIFRVLSYGLRETAEQLEFKNVPWILA